MCRLIMSAVQLIGEDTAKWNYVFEEGQRYFWSQTKNRTSIMFMSPSAERISRQQTSQKRNRMETQGLIDHCQLKFGIFADYCDSLRARRSSL